jgi:hypothetical protein
MIVNPSLQHVSEKPGNCQMKMNFIFIIRNSGDCHECQNCQKIQIAMLSTRIHRGFECLLSAIFGNPGSPACAVFARAGRKFGILGNFIIRRPMQWFIRGEVFNFGNLLAVFGDFGNSAGLPLA